MANSEIQLQKHNYTPLTDDQFRIVNILPDREDAQIRLKIEISSLSSEPFYHALSYCWGDSTVQIECQCLGNDSSTSAVYVTGTLHQALKQIRHDTDEIPIWIDQLCIDQESDNEKAHQIRLMRRIYKSAYQVVIWLGEAEEGSNVELVFGLIQNVYDQLMHYAKTLGIERTVYNDANPRSAFCPFDLTSADDREWVAFRRFLQRPWFTRVWTVQELVLARKSVIVCGPHDTTWEKLHYVCHSLAQFDTQFEDHKSHLKGTDKEITYLGFCRMYENGWGTKDQTTREMVEPIQRFTNLLRRMMCRQTSVPRDKIFGILGMAIDVDEWVYPMNLTQHFRNVYSYATKYIIGQYSDLEILRFTSVVPVIKNPYFGPKSRASWTPDYRFDNSEINNLWVSAGPGMALHGHLRLYNATGLSKAIIDVDDSLELRLEGVRLGFIKDISDLDGCAVEAVTIGQNVQLGGQWADMAASLCTTDDIYPPTGESSYLAYSRLRIRDYLPGEFIRADRDARNRSLSSIPEPSESTYIHTPNGERLLRRDYSDVITVKIIQTCKNHRLALLSSGHMGLVHRSCAPGDEVWLLMGGDMPFVLRPLVTGKYDFRGEAYVHGIMDGEYLVQNFKPTTDERDDESWLDGLADKIPFDTTEVVLI